MNPSLDLFIRLALNLIKRQHISAWSLLAAHINGVWLSLSGLSTEHPTSQRNMTISLSPLQVALANGVILDFEYSGSSNNYGNFVKTSLAYSTFSLSIAFCKCFLAYEVPIFLKNLIYLINYFWMYYFK